MGYAAAHRLLPADDTYVGPDESRPHQGRPGPQGVIEEQIWQTPTLPPLSQPEVEPWRLPPGVLIKAL